MSAERSERRGLRDGNDRVPTIARWLAQRVPPIVTELVLTAWTAEDDPEVLARWERHLVTPEMAPDISALIAEYADDAGTHCKAQLSWCDPEGKPFASKRFRGLCRKENLETVRIDGTSSSIITGLQRHLEAVLETTMRERSSSDARVERMMGLMELQLERAHERTMQLEQQNSVLADTATEAVDAAEEAAETAEEALEQVEASKGDDRVAQVIDLVSKQLLTSGS
jgi:hypothetical protein